MELYFFRMEYDIRYKNRIVFCLNFPTPVKPERVNFDAITLLNSKYREHQLKLILVLLLSETFDYI